MNDDEWKRTVVPMADTPTKALRLLVENLDYFGDSYYADLADAIMKQVEKVLQSEEGSRT